MNIARSMRQRIGLAVLVFAALPTALAQNATPVRPLPMPDARVGPNDVAQGDVWIGWSSDHKLGYVQGALEGAYWGYFNACTQASLLVPHSATLQRDCLAHVPEPHLKAQQYAALMTDFYSNYPQDKALPMHRLLLKLLEPNMHVDGVHKWLDELIESVRKSGGK